MIDLTRRHPQLTCENTHRNGFSLIELVFAVMILSIILLAASSGVVQLSNNLKSARLASEKAETQQAGAYLTDLFIAASPTYHFLHLPVPTQTCVVEKPCIRRLDPTTNRFVPNEEKTSDSVLSGLITNRLQAAGEQLQFFRDATGNMVSEPIPALNDDGSGSASTINAKITYAKPVDVSKLQAEIYGSSIYTTWPMVKASSPGFPLLTQKQDAIVLTHFPMGGTTAPPANRYAFFQATTTGFDPTTYKNSLAVLFNADDPTQYGLQYISNVFSCSTDLAHCKTIMAQINPALSDADILPLTAVELLSLKSAPAPILKQLETLLPQVTDYDPSAAHGSTWPGQAVSPISLFPVNRFPVWEAQSTPHPSGDLNPPIDVRRIQHYYTIRKTTSPLIMLPVVLRVFHLAPKTDNAETLDLVSDVIGSDQQDRHIDNAIQNPDSTLFKGPGQILYFARQIGTTKLDIIVEQKSQ